MKGKTKAEVFYNGSRGLYDYRIMINGEIVEHGKDYFLERNCIDFCLFPTPLDLIGNYDNAEQLVDLVEQIPQEKRITTLTIKRDDAVIAKIEQRVTAAKAYYQHCIQPYIQ